VNGIVPDVLDYGVADKFHVDGISGICVEFSRTRS
jgi:hypothetical protein